MRLFTAITFSEEMKNSLYHSIKELQHYALSGNYTLKENLHLTLNFIGETGRTEAVKEAMEQAVYKAGRRRFLLSTGELGRFKRREGDIYWIGVNKDPSLLLLQKELARELKKEGFTLEDREFQPHLTLGRKVIMGKDFDRTAMERSLPPEAMEVTKISLMKSERIKGRLTYTEIYHIDLE
ncbi:MAG: RNA 2',3'-cyclic phosphodiesterase [Lachnospiraceae bacterium]|nr:RNA 2',3'-cyclic phosphodiesterase [Lachnospiraceae bacterium]